MQCSQYLNARKDWQQISVANTALAAKKILEDQDKRHAAVCSAYAASVYGLSVLADNINDEKNNSTRFIVITNQKVFLKDATKISICLELPHESSSLYHLLSHFAYNDLNMTIIHAIRVFSTHGCNHFVIQTLLLDVLLQTFSIIKVAF